MVMQEEVVNQYPSSTHVPNDLNKHSMTGLSPNTTASSLGENSVEINHAAEELSPAKALLEGNDFNINGEQNLLPQQQAPPQMLPKPLFDMGPQEPHSIAFPLNIPQEFNFGNGFSGINNPSLGGQPFWSNSQHSGPSEDFFNYPPSVNGGFSFPPNLPPTQQQAISTVFNQNLMNLNALALTQQHRRSPASMYNPQYPAPRPNPNNYLMNKFGQPSWPNNSQAWNALGPSPWNQMQKRERGPGYADTMRFPQLESTLLDIMRTDLPEVRQRRNPFFPGSIDDFDEHVAAASHYPGDPMLGGGSTLPGMGAARAHYAERYSRKVFVGGLPPDIDEEEITASFRRFGPLVVDWPHKAESKSYFPPKGYAFLLFQEEASVQALIDACMKEEGKLFLCVSSPTIKEKPVQIRPWNLAESDYVMDGAQPLDPRKTIFVGGVPRPLKAKELAMIMDRLYGGVCYAGIDTDPELKYPKGAGRVAFSTQQSYIAAISARFVQLQHGDIDKRVEVKPYVLDDQMCDECHGQRCGGKYAPYFCANVTCLQYYCDQCWGMIHSRQGREYHKPLVKEGGDRTRPYPIPRW